MNTQNKKNSAELDPTFGTNGRVLLFTPDGTATDMRAVVDIEDSSFAFGTIRRDEHPYIAIAKLKNSGEPDPKFGKDGFVIVEDFPKKNMVIYSFSFNSSNDILIASILDIDGKKRPIVLHFDNHGNTISATKLPPQPSEITGNVLVRAVENDKFLVGMSIKNKGIIYRRNPDGSPDKSFGIGGELTYLPMSGGDILVSGDMAYNQSNKSIYLAGTILEVHTGPNKDRLFERGFIARLSPTGKPDPDFAQDGVFFTELEKHFINVRCNNIIPLSDGGLLCAIIRSLGFNTNTEIIKLTDAGVPDPTFNQGQGLHIIGGVDKLECQTDGKILVTSHGPIMLRRYLPDGTVDTDFGDNGEVALDPDKYFDFTLSSLIQSDRKIIVLGYLMNSTPLETAALIRLLV